MDDMTSRVLAEVNRIREFFNLGEPLTELPQGKPGSVCRCPIANALHAAVDGPTAYLPRTDQVIDLPEIIQAFVMCFDNGDFPELQA